MKNKLLISAIFLLISCTLMSQDSLTVYPFSGNQVRTMARVILEYENVLDQNKTLWEMKQWSDSVKSMQMNVIVQLDDLIVIKDDQIGNLQQQIVLEQDKFWLAEQEIKHQRGWKRFWIVATGLTAGFLALSLL